MLFPMIVLGIETTCDETACAVVQDGRKILSNVVASQAMLHRKYGGVYPELACRDHIDHLIPVIEASLKEAIVKPQEIDLISVAKGPGLIGALFIGLNAAKSLSLAWNIPFVGVNHVEAHLYAAMMGRENISFPALGVVISGGHTFLVKILEIGVYEMIGTTVDDAIGEAFDKVAAMLGLPYPGGPSIETLAKSGDSSRYPFKAGKVKGRPWDFSFSGLKTNVLYAVKGQNGDKHAPSQISDADKPHLAASFQETALGEIVSKSLKAAQAFGCQTIFLGGGVSNNQRLRQLFQKKAPELNVFWPPFGLSLDNAAMIAGLGYHVFAKQGASPLDLEPLTRIPLA
jgi:N6-L-threonylcarbamoyladenine synthase